MLSSTVATPEPRVLRTDEFDAVDQLQPMPTEITLADAGSGFAKQVINALPEFADAISITWLMSRLIRQ
jgi:hypothetical protein